MKGEPSSCSETCLMLAHCQVLGVKDKEVIHVKEEDDPEPTSPVINCEPEVSCMFVCPVLFTVYRYPELPVVFLICIRLSK